MFVGKARSLPKGREPERFFTRVGSNLTYKHQTRLAGTNTLDYYDKPLITDVKSLIGLDPGTNFIKKFTSVIYGFSYKVKAFVHGKLFKPGLINILA